jgi:diguanylate cyclase (GGDEF)-like protein
MPKFDQLTGLLSGANLEQRLDRLLDEADDEGGHVSLIVADLGGLRAINDAFGREAGDLVLKAFSAILVQVVGDSQRCYRLGGDAFAVVLPGLNADEAAREALGLQGAIRTATIPMPSGKPISLKAFTGVATYPGDASRGKALVRAADRRMHAARLSPRTVAET